MPKRKTPGTPQGSGKSSKVTEESKTLPERIVQFIHDWGYVLFVAAGFVHLAYLLYTALVG